MRKAMPHQENASQKVVGSNLMPAMVFSSQNLYFVQLYCCGNMSILKRVVQFFIMVDEPASFE